jgi:hypothetical protein
LGERSRDLAFHLVLALPNGFAEPGDGLAISRAARLGQCFAAFHDFHQERRIGARRIGLVRVPPVTSEQGRGSTHGIAQRPKRFVHFDGATEGLLALPGGSSCVAIGVQDAAEIAVTAFEER